MAILGDALGFEFELGYIVGNESSRTAGFPDDHLGADWGRDWAYTAVATTLHGSAQAQAWINYSKTPGVGRLMSGTGTGHIIAYKNRQQVELSHGGVDTGRYMWDHYVTHDVACVVGGSGVSPEYWVVSGWSDLDTTTPVLPPNGVFFCYDLKPNILGVGRTTWQCVVTAGGVIKYQADSGVPVTFAGTAPSAEVALQRLTIETNTYYDAVAATDYREAAFYVEGVCRAIHTTTTLADFPAGSQWVGPCVGIKNTVNGSAVRVWQYTDRTSFGWRLEITPEHRN